MGYISSVKIDKFWGTKNVSIKFDKAFNFLIGKNGSGKTTIINLIASVITADFQTIYSIQFESIEITIGYYGTNRKSKITVNKITDQLHGNIVLEYDVKESANSPSSKYMVENPYDERIYRSATALNYRRHNEIIRINNLIENIVSTSWLSVHRGAINKFSKSSGREDSFQSLIDVKVNDISKKFASYFSLLEGRSNLESQTFQEYVFLSLLEQKSIKSGFVLSTEDNKTDKETLIGILKHLGVPDAKAAKSANSYNSRYEMAQKRLTNKSKEDKVDFEDIVVLYDSRRITNMVDKWKEFNDAKSRIFAPKKEFESIVNEMFSNKELSFDERNNPILKFANGDKLSIEVLSSGEKQLFILLGDALLQEQRPVVYISDEPELSLHVEWQEVLFENIRKLNPNCQIISATHSPDIVGNFQDKVIEIEGCIKECS